MQASVEIAAVDAVMVQFEGRVELSINQAVHQLAKLVKQAQPSWLRDVIPAYRSLMVVYDIHQTDVTTVCATLEHWLQRQNDFETTATLGQQHCFQVCYATEYGPDLQRVADHSGLTIAQVIAQHSEREYHVYTVGFAPGFAYLGDVNSTIQTPRLVTPRSKVPAGSVAVANQQTAIYPRTSPGGWNIIGRVANWNIEHGLAIRAGDTAVFEPISLDQFLAVEAANQKRHK